MDDQKLLGADAAEVASAGSIDRDAATARHTPGPWGVIKRTGMARTQYGDCVAASHYSRPGITDGRDVVCNCSGPHGEANAHLIAAAPEMKEALKSLRNEISGLLDIAREELRPIIGNTNVRCLSNRIAEADAALAKAEGR